MRKMLIVAMLATVFAGCGSSGGTAAKGPIKVPDVVGRNLADAGAALKTAGFDHHEEDLVSGRMIIEDHNWVVATQDPAAGTTATKGTTVDLGVTKKGESVPPSTVAGATTAAPTTAEPAHPLSVQFAETACDTRGDAEFPYGFKAHWLTGLITPTWTTDHWFLKVSATVKNQYGAKRDATVECTVSGADAAPLVTGFDAY